jgi:hypothetical protein
MAVTMTSIRLDTKLADEAKRLLGAKSAPRPSMSLFVSLSH